MRSRCSTFLILSVFLISLPAVAVAASLTAITLNPTSVTGGYPATGTVSLTGLSRVGEVVVLSSDRPEVAAVPSGLPMIAPTKEAMTTPFTVTTKPVATPTDVFIRATLGGVQKHATLRVLPTAIYTITFAPPTGPAGTTIRGKVSLTGPTPPGGAIVTLVSYKPAVAGIPGFVQVAAGSPEAVFDIVIAPVATPTDVGISATLWGVQKTATLSVLPITVSAITITPPSGVGGTPIKGKVSLTSPAPPGGVILTLVSDTPATAAIPGSVQVAAGSLEAVFDIVTAPVAQRTDVKISASYAGVTWSGWGGLTLRPPLPSSLTFSPSNSVIGGTPVTATLALDGLAPPGGAAFAIRILAGGSVAFPLPPTVTVPAGANQVSFTVTTTPVWQSVQIFFKLQLSGYYDWPGGNPLLLQVLAPALKEVGFNPATVSYQAGFADGWVSLTGPAPQGGAVVLLSWSNTVAATAPPSVSVSAGATAASFKVTTKPVTQPTPFTISAYNGGVTKTATLMVTP
jgi:hypothetical protein